MKMFALLAIVFLVFPTGLNYAAEPEILVNSEKVLPPAFESDSHPFKIEHFAQFQNGQFVSLEPYLSLNEIVVKTGADKKEWKRFLITKKRVNFINYADLWLFEIKSDSKETLLGILNGLRRDKDVIFTMPVFNFPGGKYFSSGQFAARFKTKEAGVDSILRDSYNQKNNVSEKDFNEENSLALLEITSASPKNIFALVNSYLEETSIISEAYPLYERIYPPFEARYFTSKKTVTVGELFTLSLVYEQSSDIEVDENQFSFKASSLKPESLHLQLFEIKKIIGHDYLSGSGSRKKRQIDYTVSIFSPGEFILPFPVIVYKEKDWNGKITAKEWKFSEEDYPRINVAKILPDFASEIKGVTRPEILDRKTSYFEVLIFWAITLVGCGFYSEMARRRLAKARASEKTGINFKEQLANLEEFIAKSAPKEEELKKIRDFLKEIITMRFPEFSKADIRFLTSRDIAITLGKLEKAGASENFRSLLNKFLEDIWKIENEGLVLDNDRIINQTETLAKILEKSNGV